MKKRIQNTEALLKLIARRLSGRSDCMGEYSVIITDTAVFMDSFVKVYPNTHRRREHDALSAVAWACNKLNLPERYGTNTFYVEGIYTYKYDIKRKRRRWTRQ